MSVSLRDAVVVSPLAAILVGSAGRILAESPAWSGMGGSVSEAWLDSVHPDDRELAERFGRTRVDGEEFRLATPSGWKWVVASSFPCEEGIGLWFQPVGAEREDVLRSLVREREVHALKNRFISLVSHEFRTPLTVILSSAELLEHYGAKWPEDRRIQHLRKIHTAVVVMTALLDNVGLYGRSESGALENHPESIDAVSLLRDLIEDSSLALPPEQELEFEDSTDGKLLHADAKILKHVAANLISNAIRYSPHRTRVEIRTRWDAESWILEVLDRGIGVPRLDAERIWERFQRGSNIEGISGTGLGLPIVRRCCEIMGAEVALLPRDGGGTIARMTLTTSPGSGADAKLQPRSSA